MEPLTSTQNTTSTRKPPSASRRAWSARAADPPSASGGALAPPPVGGAATNATRYRSTFDGTRRLQNHAGVSMGLGLSGVFFGLPFLAVGVFVGLLVGGAVPLPSGEHQVPLWVLVAFGLVFGLVGATVVLAGLRGWLRQRRRDALFARYPDEPWRGDHDWDERVARDRGSNLLGRFAAAAFVTLFLSIFNYLAFFTREVPFPVIGIVAVFDLILVFVWGLAFYTLGRRLKYGRTRVRLSTFPFLVGHPLRVTVELPPALRDFPALRATLRLAEQRWETHRTSNGTSSQRVTYERWAEERVIPAEELGREVGLEFLIPPGAPATDLGSATAQRYWELQLDAETPGIDYHGLFLLPVY